MTAIRGLLQEELLSGKLMYVCVYISVCKKYYIMSKLHYCGNFCCSNHETRTQVIRKDTNVTVSRPPPATSHILTHQKSLKLNRTHKRFATMRMLYNKIRGRALRMV